MKVLVTGASGFIGKHLIARLVADGHEPVTVTRDAARGRPAKEGRPAVHAWDPLREPLPAAALAGVTGVIHLAGEPVAEHRWTPEVKRRILESRKLGTANLMKGIAARGPAAPGVVVSASAVGYYGDRADEELTEGSAPGADFLAQVVREWERALFDSPPAEIRKVSLRTGLVLGKDGGALGKMVPAFRAGLGGPLGTGRQWVSWIHVDDLVSLYLAALTDAKFSGPFNAVAPPPIRQGEFARALGRALHRPAVLPAPAFALRLLLGERADLLLGSQRVLPRAALDRGFRFRFAELGPALRDLFS